MKKIKSVLLGVLALGCMAFGACGGDDSYTVTLMDGDSVITTIEKDKATHLDAPQAPTKDGYTFEGWYTDEALTVPYNPDLLSANLTLYAKFSANTMYITFRLNGGALDLEEERIAVKYGETYSLPTPTKDGYDFVGWTLDGEDFPATGTYQKNNSIRVAANWEMAKYTVEFRNGDTVLATEKVAHGDKVTEWNATQAGYEVAGVYTDEAMTKSYDFNSAVTANLTLYVKMQPKTFHIIVNMDGDTDVDTTAVYGGQYNIATPTRTGYIFKGFVYNNKPFAATGTYNYISDITVTADWEKDPAYNKSTVSFYDGDMEISALQKVVENGTPLTNLADAPSKAGYAFVGWYTDEALQTAFVDGMEITDDITLYAKYAQNTYQITLNFDGGEYEGKGSLTLSVLYGDEYSLPTAPTKNGYTFDGYTAVIGGVSVNFAASGKYEYTDSVSVTAKWSALKADQDEESSELFLKKNGYFKERNSSDQVFDYVFVTGKTYNFVEFGKTVEIVGARDTVSVTDSAFTANEVIDNFVIRITKDYNGTEFVFERYAKIVDQVVTFDVGSDYMTAWGVDRSTNFLDAKTNAVMSVGKDNFIPDLAITTVNGGALTLESAYVSITATADGAQTTAFSVDAYGKISFNGDLVGKTVVLQFKPKYALTNSKVEMSVKVNEGVNVYTNDELKTAYGNRAVSSINVLRNIKAEISASDYKVVNGQQTKYPINAYDYGVYVRMVRSEADRITVNGNFFKIDGSGLPLGHNGIGEDRDFSVAGESGYYVNNMQIGLFLYNCETTSDADEYMHGGQATFNDLYLEGNYQGEASKTEKYNEKDLLVFSGTYHGIVCRGGTVNINNTTITKTNVAIFADAGVSVSDASQQAVQFNLNYAKLTYSWSNQAYAYRHTKIDVKNSYVGSCGGAAFHFDDIAQPASTTTMSSVLNIDKATKVENYIMGTETWFVSRGMGELALTVKGGVEKGLKDATTGYKLMGMPLPDTTIVKKESGLEKMNLILIVRSVNSEVGDWTEDAQKIPYVEFNAPVYLDLVKASKQDPTAFDLTNAPNAEYQVFMPFSTALVNPSVAPTDYMAGYVEVLKA